MLEKAIIHTVACNSNVFARLVSKIAHELTEKEDEISPLLALQPSDLTLCGSVFEHTVSSVLGT